MYIKRRKNSSGSTSIQVIEKRNGNTRLIKTIGSSSEAGKIEELQSKAKHYIKEQQKQLELSLSSSKTEKIIKEYFACGNRPTVRAIGPELILGRVFDSIGFDKIREELFRHLVLARLTYPVSKLKTTEYLLLHRQEDIDVSSIYRFLDRFHREYKSKVEEIAFKHTRRVLGGKVAVAFYDMTTLYFEAEDEDDLRKMGFSKDGKFQHPQIMLGLIVGENGYPIAYDIFEGNTFEGHTLIPAIERICKRFELQKPIIIADSGLLSKNNIEELLKRGYVFIVGARIKNESNLVKEQILPRAQGIKDGESFAIKTNNDNLMLIVGYSEKRAKKDASNRDRGLLRLQSRIKSGKLTKRNLINRGYNKFLKIQSEVKVAIDENKIGEDQKWDGLKGYVTNSALSPEQVISNYNHLWNIERAFRISKSDLRIRPVYHRKKDRIEAHICIAFVAYSVFKELERLLSLKGLNFSPQRAIELTKTIFQVDLYLPDSQSNISTFSKLNEEQQLLLEKMLN